MPTGEFLGSPVVGTPHFYCQGPEFDLWSGNYKIPQAAQCSQNKQTKSKGGSLVFIKNESPHTFKLCFNSYKLKYTCLGE